MKKGNREKKRRENAEGEGESDCKKKKKYIMTQLQKWAGKMCIKKE